MTVIERPVLGVNSLAPEITEKPDKVGTILGEFKRLADKPMGDDERMGAFYKAAGDLVATNPKFNSLVTDASKRDITPSHFSNLILRGVQYIAIDSGRTRYGEEFRNPEAWQDLLVGDDGILNNPDKEKKLKDILATKETTTTIYQRYVGSKIALNAVFGEQPVRVADFGCGANYGLKGLDCKAPFDSLRVVTGGPIDEDDIGGKEKVDTLIKKPLTLEEGFAVDKNDPSGEEERKWRIACSFYPQELTPMNLRKINTFEDMVAKNEQSRLKFLHGNLLRLETNHADGTLPEDHFDAVIMSTILYQMTPEQQEHVIDTAKTTLNDGGILILQDFAEKDKDTKIGVKIKGLSSEPFSYRTLVMRKDGTEWKELMRFGNGRCKKAQLGDDFDEIVNQRKINGENNQSVSHEVEVYSAQTLHK